MTELSTLVVASLKQQIATLLAQKGKIVLAGTALTDPCVRAVAELVQERRCRDEYENNVLVLIVTRQGVDG
jgi:hypothetical protein